MALKKLRVRYRFQDAVEEMLLLRFVFRLVLSSLQFCWKQLAGLKARDLMLLSFII